MTKRVFSIALLLAVVLTAFSGCSEEMESSDLNIFSEASYDNESKFVPEQSIDTSEEVSEEPLTGEFVVKDKKYTFEGNDLVIVSVENKTNKNYSVTVTGTYLDADGKTLKTETQTSDQYSAGFCQYFLFEPKMKFDKFTYTFERKPTALFMPKMPVSSTTESSMTRCRYMRKCSRKTLKSILPFVPPTPINIPEKRRSIFGRGG